MNSIYLYLYFIKVTQFLIEVCVVTRAHFNNNKIFFLTYNLWHNLTDHCLRYYLRTKLQLFFRAVIVSTLHQRNHCLILTVLLVCLGISVERVTVKVIFETTLKYVINQCKLHIQCVFTNQSYLEYILWQLYVKYRIYSK